MIKYFRNNINICKNMRRNMSYGYYNINVNEKIEHYFDNINKKRNIKYINDCKSCKECVDEIRNGYYNLKDLNMKMIGLDIEGYKIGKYGIVSIIQICYEDIYIFDIYKCDNLYMFINYLREILECDDIIKLTHDCREDCSILYNQYNIHLKNILDTQVAYNLLFKKTKNYTNTYQISYDDLLKKYLFINNNHKIYFHKMITMDNYIYLKRPIMKELISYAIQDVIYLKPLILCIIDQFIIKQRQKDEKEEEKNEYVNNKKQNNKIKDKEFDNTSNTLQNICNISSFNNHDLYNIKQIIQDIIYHSKKYVNYQFLNSHIKDDNKLQKGMIIEGMVVSCNNTKMYLKLNMRKRGVILNYLQNKYEIGDIIKAVIINFTTNDYINLGLYDENLLTLHKEKYIPSGEVLQNIQKILKKEEKI
ncbi:3'-5' exonuclease, putative [Plasmodium gaboni]|uniref:3'-5' exonuclease, putative n=1 Tax=Plasmodium gaboni TaxID=647221 RepID=A0ABY1UGX7_9APIC|nr:3'-5' exonuclease, putative [Plasmodium gaboni]